MDPETTPEPTAPATTTEPAAPSAAPAPSSPPAPALTAETVKEMIAQAVREARNTGAADARRAIEAKQGKTPPKQAPTAETTPPAATGDDAEFGEALSDALGEYPFDRDQRREVRSAARRDRPEDIDGFVSRWARMFGKAAGQPAQPPPPAGTQPPVTNPAGAPPSAARPVPPTPPPPAPPSLDREGEPVLRALAEEDRQDAWQAYVRRKGANPADPYDPRNRAVWREHRKRFEGELATASVRIGARPVR